MKLFMRSFLSLALLASTTLVQADCCSGNVGCNSRRSSCDCHSIFIPRSTNSNTAYNFLPFAHKTESCDWNGGFELGAEYQRSFNDKDIAKCLFGTNTLLFEGSQLPNRNANALIADYFGLSPLFQGSIKFSPRIENINLHFQSYLGFDSCVEGLYGQVNFTFTHQKRELIDDNDCNKCSDTVISSTTNNLPFPPGYMAIGTVAPFTTIKEALIGKQFGDLTGLADDSRMAWRFGKFDFSEMTKNEIAGVDVILGYDFWRKECGHFGAFFQYTAPTGNKPCADYIFSPVVGNGKHHEVGGGITAHYKLWEGECNNAILVYLDGNITTMLENCQLRSFDFKNAGCMSRYMLLKEMVQTGTRADGYAYDGHLINGINFATRQVKVKVSVKGDATLRFIYQTNGFDLGLGYNIYGQDREKVKCFSVACDAIDTTKFYAKKGCTGVHTFEYAVAAGAITGEIATFNLNTTASDATITNCGTVDNPSNFSTATTAGVDWVNFFTHGVNADAVPNGTLVTNVTVSQQSLPAAVLSTNDLDTHAGRSPRQLIHKGFATVSYTWRDCDWVPYLALGAEVEGGSHHCDLKQWGVWFKGGISF